jgi:hypothetical protein
LKVARRDFINHYMFVRYRKLPCDGFQPRGVAAKIACAGRCGAVPGRWGMRGRRAGQCPVKPRCRWRIGLGTVELAFPQPYRLQVQLVENRRDGGQVRQEYVATLGSIDGWLVPDFWAGLDPDIVAKIKSEDWDTRSIKARMAFWDQAKPRLDRLANRLDPKAVRLAIHRRIPWPMQDERDLAEARADFSFWKAAYDGQIKHIEGHEKVIARANKEIAEARENTEKWAPLMAEAARKLGKAQP